MRSSFVSGIAFGLLAGALWGIIYVAPLWLSDYSPVTIALGRFVIFGLSAFPVLWACRHELHEMVTRRDVYNAFALSMIGSILYYPFLAICVRYAGAPLAGMLTSLVPVTVAIFGNLRARHTPSFVPWYKIMPPLVVMVVGLLIANGTEFAYKLQTVSLSLYIIGVVAGILTVGLWTWFALWNSQYLLTNRKMPTVIWTALQGATVIPIVVMSAMVWFYALGGMDTSQTILGPRPGMFIVVTVILAIACSWLAMWCWNLMSQRVPQSVGGQLIFFESFFAVIYAHVYREQWPSMTLILGYSLLLAGVLLSLWVFRHERAQA